jgi:hypothetical protein
VASGLEREQTAVFIIWVGDDLHQPGCSTQARQLQA